MSETRICPACSGELRFNQQIGFFECAFCGKLFSVDGDERPTHLAKVDRLVLDHKYEEAEKELQVLLGNEPDHAVFRLRALLYRYRVSHTATLLTSVSNSEKQMEDLRDDPEWEGVKRVMPDSGKNIVDLVMDYLDTNLKMAAIRKEYGPEIAGVQVPKEEVLDPYDKKLMKKIPWFFVAPVFLLVFGGLAALIGVGIANARTIEDTEKFGAFLALVAVFLTLAATAAFPFLRDALLQKKAKAGKVRFLKDGTPVVKSKKYHEYPKAERTPMQEAALRYQELARHSDEVYEAVRKREAELEGRA